MSDAKLPGIIQHLRVAVAARNSPGVTDAQLLERYVARRDEAAFELLVWRHGRMVLGTCRRLLGDAHEAEDAFQACFLALVRRAGTIGKGESVGGWLHKVAYRLALGARARRQKRQARERSGAPADGPPDPATEAARREVRRALDDEVGRLPDKFRVPFVLCYLEGLSNAEAARELGCPVGTIDSRLARARGRVGAGLSRRGVTLPAGLLTALLAEGAAQAAVPATLVTSTAKAAALPAAARAVAEGLISSHVAALTEGVLRTMVLTKLNAAAAVVLLGAVLAGTGAGALNYGGAADKPAEKPPASAEAGKIARLIDQLSSDSFAEREKATKELEGVGVAALPALRAATRSADPERRKRATDLLKRIELPAERARLLAPKRVRLVYKDTPLADAVADFKKKSGYDVALSDPDGKLKGRTVTLDTGDVTFWRALDLFCQKAGLVETGQRSVPRPVRGMMGAGAAGLPGAAAGGGMGGAGGAPAALPGGGAGGGAGAAPASLPGRTGGAGQAGGAGGAQAGLPARGGLGGGGGMAPPGAIAGLGGMLAAAPGDRPGQILLADGRPRPLPTDDRTSVRVRALDNVGAAGPPGGEILLPLEVTLEPRLRWQPGLTARVGKAVDDQDQTLEQATEMAAGAPVALVRGVPLAGRVAAGPWAGMVGALAAGAGRADLDGRARVAFLRLKKGAKAAKSLKELSGTITAHLLDEARPLVTVEDIHKSTGQAVKGADGGAIRVVDVSKVGSGRGTQVNVRLEVELPGGAAGPFRTSIGGGAVAVTDANASEPTQHELSMSDANGNLLPPAGLRVGAGAKLGEITVTYLTQPGQGQPTRLSLSARKGVAVEVPFTLKDVPLP